METMERQQQYFKQKNGNYRDDNCSNYYFINKMNDYLLGSLLYAIFSQIIMVFQQMAPQKILFSDKTYKDIFNFVLTKLCLTLYFSNKKLIYIIL